MRPTYASNALAKVKSEDAIKFMTIRNTNFEKLVAENSNISSIENLNFDEVYSGLNKDRLVKFEKEELTSGDRPELGAAKIVK